MLDVEKLQVYLEDRSFLFVRLNMFYCKMTKGWDTSFKQPFIVLSLNNII